MSFPDKKHLDRAQKKVKDVEGTLMLPPVASPLERLRWDICQKFLKFKKQHDMSQDQLAHTLGIDKAKISKILRHRITEFSTDRLISLYQELNPGTKIKVS